MAAPLIGGVIAAAYGFPALIMLAVLVYALSFVPLIYIPELKVPLKFNLRNIPLLFFQNPKYAAQEFVENIREEMEAIVLPIFLFVSFKNVLSIGLIGTLLSLSGFFFMFLVGKYSDKVSHKTFLKIGGLVMILLWLSRYFNKNEVIFYV